MRSRSLALAVVLALALAVGGCGGGGGGAPPVPFTAADLADLSVSAGALSPAFSADTTSYIVRVPTLQTSLTVTPTALESGATMTVNGTAVDSGTASGDIALAMGPNDVAIVVTEPDGIIQKTYVIQVIRGEQDADLADLTISAGTLSPAFSPATTFYTVRVPSAQASVTVTPAASDSGATIQVNGEVVASGTPSSPIGLSFGMNTITVMVTATDGVTQKVYTVLVFRVAQEAYLKASNTDADDRFGYAVAIDGDTIVVGAWAEDGGTTGVNGNQADNSATDSGAAYVFTRTGVAWNQQAYLKASNADPWRSDLFGYAVAIDGDTIVVGAHCEDSSATGVNGNGEDNGASTSGAAYVFTRTGGVWSQQAYLKASNTDAGDEFGRAVAINGDTIVVGTRMEDSSATGANGDETNNAAGQSGAAYVFTRTGGVWSQQAYLKASNTEAYDLFGHAVVIDGDTIVVGAFGEESGAIGVNGDEADNSAPTSGAAYVFVRSGGAWTQEAYLKAFNTETTDGFGWSVAVDGDTIVVGADYEDSSETGTAGSGADNSASGSGAAYVFVRSGGVWTQQAYLKASNTAFGDFFGYAVAIDVDTIVVAAWHEDSSETGTTGTGADNGAIDSGAAYVFVRSGGVWSQWAYLKASNTDAGDWFGCAVAVDAGTVVVGAYREDSNETGTAGTGADNSAPDSGAAYVFR